MSVASSSCKRRVAALLVTTLLAVPGFALAGPEEDYQAGLKAFNEDDQVVAMEMLGKASEAGHAQAMVLLGDLLDRAERNEDAVKWYRAAANQGDLEGMINLALMYANGEGIAKDDGQAMAWLEKAAEKGSPRAMLIISNSYRGGDMGNSINYDKSFEWLVKATEANHLPAVRMMADVYRKGLLGFDPDPQLAKDWEMEARALEKKEKKNVKDDKKK